MKPSPGYRRRRHLRITRLSLLFGTAWAVIAWVCIIGMGARSVVFTAPILFFTGGFCIYSGWRLGYGGALWLGIAEAGVVLVFVLLVNLLSWSPIKAQAPFIGMGAAYLLAAIPASIHAWSHPPRVLTPGECEKCGYNLFGLREPRCPECGLPFNPAAMVQQMPPT